MIERNMVWIFCCSLLLASCKTTSGRTQVKDDAVVTSTLAWSPGIKKAGDGASWILSACSDSTVSVSSPNANHMGCVAADGKERFWSMSGGNNSADALAVKEQICQAGFDPLTFESSCYVKDEANWRLSPLAPPSGAHVKGKVQELLDPCGSEVVRLNQKSAKDIGCIATDWVNMYYSLNGGNNGLDGVKTWSQICAAGGSPSTFNSVCLEQD